MNTPPIPRPLTTAEAAELLRESPITTTAMNRPSPEAIAKAGRILATGRRAAEQMNARELAEAAWHAGCGKTVDQLEDEIRQRRGLPPLDRGDSR